MFLVHRLVKRMVLDSGSRRRRRWSWILTPLYALAAAAVVTGVARLTGVNVLYELTAAVERAQDVTLVVSAAALAAALVGISVALPHVLQVKALDGERAEEFALAVLGLVFLAWASTLVLLFQWLLAALSSSPEAIRLVPALSVVTWLILMLDGLVGLPFSMIDALQALKANSEEAETDERPPA